MRRPCPARARPRDGEAPRPPPPPGPGAPTVPGAHAPTATPPPPRADEQFVIPRPVSRRHCGEAFAVSRYRITLTGRGRVSALRSRSGPQHDKPSRRGVLHVQAEHTVRRLPRQRAEPDHHDPATCTRATAVTSRPTATVEARGALIPCPHCGTRSSSRQRSES